MLYCRAQLVTGTFSALHIAEPAAGAPLSDRC